MNQRQRTSNNYTFSLLLIFLLIFSLEAGAAELIAARTATAAAAWPAAFSIGPNEQAAFPIPNTGQGSIKIAVEWSGSPLSVSVTGSASKALIPVVTKNAPLYTFDINTASISPAACPIFMVRVDLPANMPAAARASGKVTVTPAVDMSQVNSLVMPYQPQQSALRQKLQQSEAAFMAAAKAREKNANAAIASQNAALARNLIANANSERTAYSNTLSTMAKPATSGIKVSPALASMAGILNRGKILNRLSVTTPAPAPALSGINPASAVPGQQITLSGVGLTGTATEVWFTFAGKPALAANILSFSAGANNTCTLVVQMPEQADITGQQNCQVYARALDRNPAVNTNTLNIQYVPIVAPSITYIDPVEVGPQVSVNIYGNNFTNADVVRFALGGVFNTTVATSFVNSTRLTATIPVYSSRALSNGWLCVERQTPGKTVSSQCQPLVFRPTMPVITEIPASGAADAPFMIRGMAFEQSGEVHAVDASGVDTVLSVVSWTSTHIVARAPSVYGFTGSRPYTMYVKNASGKSDTKTFSLTPAMEVVLMNMDDMKTTQDFVLINKGGAWCEAISTNHDAIGTYMYARHQADFFAGYKGDDMFYLNRRLKNGWKVDSVSFINNSGGQLGGASAYVAASNPNTDWPLVKVHWWCDAPWGNAIYQFAIQIKGPKGVAY